MKGNKKNLTGRKKGGTLFPKYSLKQVVPAIKPLISKTHLNPISIEQLNSGVFSMASNSPNGKVKYSAMKQFGLLEGPYAAIKASQLAKDISYASGEERSQLLAKAFMNVKAFKNTFETFHTATTAKARVLGYVTTQLKVHPDSGTSFLEGFVESAIEAGLGRISGDEIELFGLPTNTDTAKLADDSDEVVDEEAIVDSEAEDENDIPAGEDNSRRDGSLPPALQSSLRPNIDIKIDPSLDPDKLEKQLLVLRKFKLI